MIDYDKEHFAREPDIPNPTFAPEDAEFDDVKFSTYTVNAHQIDVDAAALSSGELLFWSTLD